MNGYNTSGLSSVVGLLLVVTVLLGRYAEGPVADFLAGTATGILVVAGVALLYSVGRERRSPR